MSVSAIKRSVLVSNLNCDLKMTPAIERCGKVQVYKGFIMRVWQSSYLFLRKVSAIKRFHCIHKCNLFQINWGKSVTFIHELPKSIHEKKFWTRKTPTRKISDP